jgi:regulatory protein
VSPIPASAAEGAGAEHALIAEVRNRAVKLLANREHSRLELARKLAARDYPSNAIGVVLDALERDGLLSEARLVEAYVAERLAKGFGPLRIRLELREKGLPDDLVEPHVELGDERCIALLRTAHNRRFGAQAPADARERAKRGRFLEYRGFPPRLIARLLDSDDEAPE